MYFLCDRRLSRWIKCFFVCFALFESTCYLFHAIWIIITRHTWIGIYYLPVHVLRIPRIVTVRPSCVCNASGESEGLTYSYVVLWFIMLNAMIMQNSNWYDSFNWYNKSLLLEAFIKLLIWTICHIVSYHYESDYLNRISWWRGYL